MAKVQEITKVLHHLGVLHLVAAPDEHCKYSMAYMHQRQCAHFIRANCGVFYFDSSRNTTSKEGWRKAAPGLVREK